MKKVLYSLLFLLVLGFNAKATSPPDEGMWLPMFVDRLNYVDMQAMGLNLTAEEIYSVNNACLKDAIVGLSNSATPSGFFCTGEVISDQGLVLTNHHCGFDVIQKHSSLEHDYLTDGFWAMSKEEELMNENLSVSFLESMEDVTDIVLAGIDNTTEASKRKEMIAEAITKLEKEYSEDGRYNVNVNEFFAGNEYYLFVYTVYTDVRFVGAPPSSIGKFGGDTDNWMWPRHTGDFSMFRIYTAPDGTPADYSLENVPLVPKHHLPISLKGIQENDFSMIWGYPGGTERYLTSYGIDHKLNYFWNVLEHIWDVELTEMREQMDSDDGIRIKYASDYAGTANGWKNFIGMQKALKQNNVIAKKQVIENAFTEWVNEDDSRKSIYGNALSIIQEAYNEQAQYITDFYYIAVGGIGASANIQFAATQKQSLTDLLDGVKKSSEAREIMAPYMSDIEAHYKDYDLETDKKIFIATIEMIRKDLPKSSWPAFINTIDEDYKGCVTSYANDVYEQSPFASLENFNAFLDKPKMKVLEEEQFSVMYTDMLTIYFQFSGKYRASQAKLAEGSRLFVAGLRQATPNKVYYPDANSTMRLTYGKVDDYYPADAVHYDYVTTIGGIMAKEDTNSSEFKVPQKLKDLYAAKDYGRYGENGDLNICFLTNHDITGGNSGSPVINGDGQLIGTAFDGNWEAMSGDVMFEPNVQRTISVDVRYVLFIIDKFAGAQNLIDEMTIIE